mmetsp:Transcript_24384/g.76191  ORF Transcript_24384/g.76191 Transcript_24384/m.76191 type:complete len:215 (+) Transcript_24384:160-804(+)
MAAQVLGPVRAPLRLVSGVCATIPSSCVRSRRASPYLCLPPLRTGVRFRVIVAAILSRVLAWCLAICPSRRQRRHFSWWCLCRGALVSLKCPWLRRLRRFHRYAVLSRRSSSRPPSFRGSKLARLRLTASLARPWPARSVSSVSRSPAFRPAGLPGSSLAGCPAACQFFLHAPSVRFVVSLLSPFRSACPLRCPRGVRPTRWSVGARKVHRRSW